MCEICMRSPHAPNCPNATHKVVGQCEECGVELEQGDKYYIDYNHLLFCSADCALDYYMVREVEEGE